MGSQDGGTVTQLIEKTLALRHAEAATYKANTHIYHLAARSFYAALGQEDNRNRRRKELVTIKAKLMALDFALAHPGQEYLTTEQEKIEFFQRTFGIERQDLPTKRYASRAQITDRYFVEKFPIFYSPFPQPACPPVVSFCFVDPGMAGVSGLETFLNKSARLFAKLPEFAVIYVAANDALFSKARTAFESFSLGRKAASNGAVSDDRTRTMLQYFEARSLYESRQYASFDRAKLIQLRDLQQEFSGPQIEALYGRWTAVGSDVLIQELTPALPLAAVNSGAFSTYLLEHSYDLFGSLTTH